MLTRAECELIAAAVDVDLSPEREVAFQALLARDPAAVALFARLKTDSRRLRGLPRRPAPAGLAGAVVVRVAALPRATPISPRTPDRRVPKWAPYAIAASLLFAIASASFWVSLQESADDVDRVAQQQRLPRPRNPGDRFARSPALPADPGPERGPAPRQSSPEQSDDSRLAVLPRPTEVGPEPAPQPRPSGNGDLIGSGLLNTIPPFESVEARLPVLTTVHDLAQKDVRDRIVSELGREPAFRLDLFVKDVPRAAAVFQSAARTSGWAVTVDVTTQERLRKKLPAPLAVYTDALKPGEIARFLAALAKRDQADKSGPVFTTVHLVPFQAAEQRELRDLLGSDVGAVKRKAIGSRSSTTAGEADKAHKPAIMLTYMPTALRVSPTASKEIKAFLDDRTERDPTGVQLLVVIRPLF